MIDLHCHLLPAIDDGPADLGTALSMAQLQLAAGIQTVAVTPHVSWDMPNDAARIARGVDELRVALDAAGIALDVVTGAEIDLQQALEIPEEELRRLALGGGSWLLIEAPLRQAAPLEPVVSRLLTRGHDVLLAHPERSPVLQRDPDAVRRLVRAGVLMQLTAGSLVGDFGRTVQRFSERLVDDGLVHNVASDAHDPRRRPPGIRQQLIDAGLERAMDALVQEVPAALLAGGPVPRVPHPLRRPRGLLRGLRRR